MHIFRMDFESEENEQQFWKNRKLEKLIKRDLNESEFCIQRFMANMYVSDTKVCVCGWMGDCVPTFNHIIIYIISNANKIYYF